MNSQIFNTLHKNLTGKIIIFVCLLYSLKVKSPGNSLTYSRVESGKAYYIFYKNESFFLWSLKIQWTGFIPNLKGTRKFVRHRICKTDYNECTKDRALEVKSNQYVEISLLYNRRQSFNIYINSCYWSQVFWRNISKVSTYGW